ncbi:MAG: NAD-dependent epimerase/dehydratase family protein, partial [Ilumatobacteraceae bacterium]
MTILITGGAGYIGSHTARLLTEMGRNVVVLDTLERGYRDAIPGI